MKLKLELEPMEPTNFSASRDTIYNAVYMGAEKRIKTRRVTPDRREIIRFDINKGDRRNGEDRRRSTQKC